MNEITRCTLAERVARYSPDRASVIAGLIRTPQDAKMVVQTIWSRAQASGPSVYATPLAAMERLYQIAADYVAGRVASAVCIQQLLAEAADELNGLSDAAVLGERELLAALTIAAPTVFPLYFDVRDSCADGDGNSRASVPRGRAATTARVGRVAAAPAIDDFTRVGGAPHRADAAAVVAS